MKTLIQEILYSSHHSNGGFTAEDDGKLPLAQLEQWGYTVPGPLITSRVCGERHSVAILHAKSPITGEDLYYESCECGVERVDPESLRTWRTKVEKIMEETVNALSIRGGITPIVPDYLWKLGRKKTRDFFYLRVFHSPLRHQIVPELLKVGKAVVLTARESSVRELQYDVSHPCAALETIAQLGEDGRFIIDREILEDVLGDAAEMEDISKIPVPKPKRGSRAAKIEKLVKEMEHHLRAARAHAQATADRGEIELLPRPSLGDMAKRTEMTKMDVSRCLNDPSAKLLRLLWEKALDLKQIFR